MRSVLAQIDDVLKVATGKAIGVTIDPQARVAADSRHGDYQTTMAMKLSRDADAGLAGDPREVATQIVAKIDTGTMVDDVSVAGKGFINIKLSSRWVATYAQAMASDPRLGVGRVDNPDTVVVDYSAPNIAKELHVGHLRSTIIGDSLARVLDFLGHTVIRQNHIGDWGTQFGMLIANLVDNRGTPHLALADLEAFYVDAKKRFDDDPAFRQLARQKVVDLQSGDPSTIEAWKLLVRKTREHYTELYGRLGVRLTADDERGESFYNSMLPATVADLVAMGIATQSEGATVVFIGGGDKPPAIIQKADGGYLYTTTDLAAIRYRTSILEATRIIYVVDSRQTDHFQQIFAIAKKAGWTDNVRLEHASFGTMFGGDGRPFRTKEGGTVKLRTLLDEAEARAFEIVTEKNPSLSERERHQIATAVGIGAIKYADLSKDRMSDYQFSFDRMLALEGNTAPYIQYAHARIQSILRKAGSASMTDPWVIRAETNAHEHDLLKLVVQYWDILEKIAEDLRPHYLCAFLYDVATSYNRFFEHCPVLDSDAETRGHRLAICSLVGRVLSAGLDLLGISHPDKL